MPDNLWQWRNIWGSILFVLQIVDIKYYLNLARSTKKFTEMFQKLRPKLQLLAGREKKMYVPTVWTFICLCSAIVPIVGYSSNSWVECSNYLELNVPTIGS